MKSRSQCHNSEAIKHSTHGRCNILKYLYYMNAFNNIKFISKILN